jgi:hypothetical protein
MNHHSAATAAHNKSYRPPGDTTVTNFPMSRKGIGNRRDWHAWRVAAIAIQGSAERLIRAGQRRG